MPPLAKRAQLAALCVVRSGLESWTCKSGSLGIACLPARLSKKMPAEDAESRPHFSRATDRKAVKEARHPDAGISPSYPPSPASFRPVRQNVVDWIEALTVFRHNGAPNGGEAGWGRCPGSSRLLTVRS